MDIKRAGSQPSNKGPDDWFTGAVRIDSPFKGTDPARVSGAIVSFEPGARTAGHTHPLGQTLIVTAGCGRVQREGGPIEEIRPGRLDGPRERPTIPGLIQGWEESGRVGYGSAPQFAVARSESHLAGCLRSGRISSGAQGPSSHEISLRGIA